MTCRTMAGVGEPVAMMVATSVEEAEALQVPTVTSWGAAEAAMEVSSSYLASFCPCSSVGQYLSLPP